MPKKTSQNEDTNRLRYIRALERFIRSVIGYLVKEDEANYDGFVAKVRKQQEFLSRIKPVVLYKEEFIQKQSLVNAIIDASSSSSDDFAKTSQALLKASNQLHKYTNSRKYKKDKHTKAAYHDGY